MQNAKPIQLHILEGNPNRLTKEEIDRRRAAEIRYGNKEFKPTKLLRKNKKAYAKWKELIALYKDSKVDFVTTSDSDLIENYCFAYADYLDLRAAKAQVVEEAGDNIVLGINTISFIEGRINRKLELMLSMQDKLILTPSSKLKSIGRKPGAKEVDPLEEMGFGNV